MSTLHGLSRRSFLTCSTALGAGAVVAGALRAGRLLAADEPPAGAPPATPAEALERLREGNARFAAGQPINPQRDLARLRELAPQQRPFAALLGCADSRVPVELVYDQGFGDIFVVRVAGNVATSVEIASLEYGTRILGASALIVLGHSNCGAVKAALQGGEVPGQISTLYSHIAPALKRKTMDLDTAIVANVRYQMRKLRKGSTVIAKLLADGKLALVGGVFDLATASVKPVEV
jgi:carbonic anhydrase